MTSAEDEERAGSLRAHRREGRVEVAEAASFQRLKLNAPPPGRRHPPLSQHKGVARGRGIPERSRPRSFRDGLLEQLELLSGDLRAQRDRQPRDVPPRSRQTGDEPQPDGVIAPSDGDKRDRCGRILRGQHRRRRRDDDELHAEPNQLCREVGSRSALPPANRHSMMMFCPSTQPSSFIPC